METTMENLLRELLLASAPVRDEIEKEGVKEAFEMARQTAINLVSVQYIKAEIAQCQTLDDLIDYLNELNFADLHHELSCLADLRIAAGLRK